MRLFNAIYLSNVGTKVQVLQLCDLRREKLEVIFKLETGKIVKRRLTQVPVTMREKNILKGNQMTLEKLEGETRKSVLIEKGTKESTNGSVMSFFKFLSANKRPNQP